MLQSSRMYSTSSLTLIPRRVGRLETWTGGGELWWEEALSRDVNSHFSHKHCRTTGWTGFFRKVSWTHSKDF